MTPAVLTTPVALPPGPPANPGLDYAYLKDEGTRIIQRQAGKVWTDYNESDPGVTTLEQLCYALTELSYRAELPLADLLVGRPGGEIDPRRQALYPARDIFPVNPVTEDDYRRLLIDRVPRVANAWITPWRPSPDAPRGVHGLYDVALYVPGLDPACSPGDEAKVVDAVRRVYCAHRNLCEDLRSVRVLAQAPATVHADVAVSGARAPDQVMAGLLFRLGLFFAPEPARRPLDALLREGVPPSEIFDGPLPLNGFIADGELQPRADAIPVQDVARAAASAPGVLGVQRLTVQTGGRTYGAGETVPVGRGRILRLDARPGRGGFSIRLLCNGVEVRPDPARVERALRRLWAEHRQPWPLDEQYPESFAMPAGRYRARVLGRVRAPRTHLTGTATDAGGGRVAGIEVSTNGGDTWHPATGTSSWSYTYVQKGMGSVSLRVRATDAAGCIGSTTAGSLCRNLNDAGSTPLPTVPTCSAPRSARSRSRARRRPAAREAQVLQRRRRTAPPHRDVAVGAAGVR